jgi:hypothetical protein
MPVETGNWERVRRRRRMGDPCRVGRRVSACMVGKASIQSGGILCYHGKSAATQLLKLKARRRGRGGVEHRERSRADPL